MRYTDTHAHVFEPGLPLANVRRYAPEYKATKDMFVEQLDLHHMERGILIQPSFLGTDNSYMIDAIDTYPERLYGVAVIEPDTPLAVLEEMKRHNIIGIRLNLYGKEIPDLYDSVWQNCLQNIKKLDWHVELHIDAKVLPELIAPLLEAGVKVVVDHFGKPNIENPLEDKGFQYLLAQGETSRVWVKISAAYRLGGADTGVNIAQSLMPHLLEAFGAKRLLWGSDWPHTQNESVMTYDKAYEMLKVLLPEELWEDVLVTAVDELL